MVRQQIDVVDAASVDQTRDISSESETNPKLPTETPAHVATVDQTRGVSSKSAINPKLQTAIPARQSR